MTVSLRQGMGKPVHRTGNVDSSSSASKNAANLDFVLSMVGEIQKIKLCNPCYPKSTQHARADQDPGNFTALNYPNLPGRMPSASSADAVSLRTVYTSGSPQHRFVSNPTEFSRVDSTPRRNVTHKGTLVTPLVHIVGCRKYLRFMLLANKLKYGEENLLWCKDRRVPLRIRLRVKLSTMRFS